MNVQIFVFIIALGFLAACNPLAPLPEEKVHVYQLSDKISASVKKSKRKTQKTLFVSVPSALPGFNTNRMAYVIKPFEIDYFALNRWVSSPSHMLQPNIIQALSKLHFYHAVVGGPNVVNADLRLDTKITDFSVSYLKSKPEVKLAFTVSIVNTTTNKVIRTKAFKATRVTQDKTPYAAVIATNKALSGLLGQLSQFCLKNST